MPTESTSKKEEGNLEYQRKALDEEVEPPILEPIEFALTLLAALGHRPARTAQVPAQPLLSQHGGECGEQGQKKARVHETSDGDDLARRALLNGWNGGGLTGDGGPIESEEDGAEESRRLFVRVGLEVRMDIDDESGADGRGQTRL